MARRRSTVLAMLVVSGLGPALAARAQGGAPRKFTLEEAINFALKNYPAIRAAAEGEAGAHAGVELARTSYLPRADFLWQSNRATRNNVFGQVLPQSVIPSISGPVLATASGASVWGSAGGVLFSWEPFDFGARHASVSASKAGEARAGAEADLARLRVAAATADAFLTLLAAEQRTRAAQADVNRREVFAKSVHVLVDNQLRPGADASRADAELAGARIERVRSELNERESRAALAETLGLAGKPVEADAGKFASALPDATAPEEKLESHPAAIIERDLVDEFAARARAAQRSEFPRFNLQSAFFGRGSGANVDGTTAGGLNGLGLERSNWGAGLTVSFPLFDLASASARRKIEAANERRERASFDETVQALTGRLERARAAFDAAREVAQNTPAQLEAARATESQNRARYQAGLGTIVDVAEAQRLLVQAESDDAVARLSVWRGLLTVAAAGGDLSEFLRLARQGEQAAGQPEGGR